MVYHSIIFAGGAMKKWYSDRGAKRGLITITVFFVLWMCWAVGYTEGIIKHPPMQNHQLELEPVLIR